MEAAVMPLPSPDTTPPVTKMCLAMPLCPSWCQSPPARPPPLTAGSTPTRRHAQGTATPMRWNEGFSGAGVAPVWGSRAGATG